ncbi:hypothetical protein Y032_0168g163 [Ancylostoma ceylanicum]|uniref:ET module n=1 Tax=Ancylostoma ceylanicum TaxID=53326 RepID=A0A016SW78_9BILA|nr:hypothetical protein Y032_0168g163 [Ancylostoma ceylanicum]
MTSLRLVAVLLALVCVTVALQCYSGKYDKGQKPSVTTECSGKYCMTIEIKGDKSVYHQCDMTNACNKEGCEEGQNGDTKCCCSKNLCNSSSKLSALFTVVPIALMKLFV